MPLVFFSRNSSVIPGPIIAILCLRWHGNQRCFHAFNNRQLLMPLRMYHTYRTCTVNSPYESVQTSISHPIIYPLLINHCSYSRLVQSAMKRNKKMKNKNILLIDNNGTNLGVTSMDIALQMAEAQGMTLVQVSYIAIISDNYLLATYKINVGGVSLIKVMKSNKDISSIITCTVDLINNYYKKDEH